MILQRSSRSVRCAGENHGRSHQYNFPLSCRTGRSFMMRTTITDQPQRQIVAELIREKALHAAG